MKTKSLIEQLGRQIRQQASDVGQAALITGCPFALERVEKKIAVAHLHHRYES
jgi:hypothetical protein